MFDKIKGFFMSNKISAQHILVDQKFEAEDLVKKLEQGESFEKLAADYSNCPSGKQGGNLGEFGKGMMVKPFEDAAFGLEVGAVSEPVQTQFGFHIIKRLA
jgi:peptidyl-prolyl cis-trans isomerase C